MKYRTKVLIFLLSAVLLTGGVLLGLIYRSADRMLFSLIQEKVLTVAVSAAPRVDGDRHHTLRGPEDQASEAYAEIEARLREVRDANRRGSLDVAFIYTIRPVGDGAWEYVVDAEEPGEDKSAIGDRVEFREGEAVIPELGRAQVDATFAKDSFGTWLSAFAPVKDSAGRDVALVGVDIEAASVRAQSRRLLTSGLVALGLAILAASIASVFLARRATAPLKALEAKVLKIGSGDLSARAEVDSNDEFGKLAVAINFMAAGLQEREAFKGALVRFVSGRAAGDVVAGAGDAGIAGDHAELRRVSVFVVALEGFDRAAGELPAEKVSQFLGEWYAAMIDIIVQHRGSLERSEGQTITATFGAQIHDAIQERHAIEAALSIEKAFERTRAQWSPTGLAEVAVQVVVHTAEIAVVGHGDEQALDSAGLAELLAMAAEVHDAVDAASAGIVITSATAEGLRGTLPLEDVGSLAASGDRPSLQLHRVEMPTGGLPETD